jgi:ribosome-associated protein
LTAAVREELRLRTVGEPGGRDYIDRAGADPAVIWRLDLSSENRPAARSKAALNIVPAPLQSAVAVAEGEGPEINLDNLGAGERGRAILSIILAELEDNKAEEVVTISLRGKTDIADAMVVASGRSARHVGAMADKVVKSLKTAGLGRARMEGAPACDWVLIDAEDVIVHLFRPEVRNFYNLERIWSETARAPVKTDS